MSISPTPILTLLFLTLLISTTPFSNADSTSSVLSTLETLQSQSPTGLITLTDDLLRRILSLPTPRPFHFLVFFDAKHLHSKTELALPTLKSEFSLLSTSFHTNNPDSLFFFFAVEFQESQSSFAHFGVNSLPHIRLVPPQATDVKTQSVQMDASDYARLAESMSEFIELKSGLSVGPIHRPPIVSRFQIGIIVTLLLVATPFLIRRVLLGKTFLHEKGVWMMGAIFVYFFSVSGAMFNVIRKMPMFLADREDPNKLVFFYKGSGMQLGAEGFSVGFLYTIVGLLLAFATHVLVRVRNVTVQRVVMIGMMFVSFWAVRKVVSLDNWKTGYGIHAYWPSSWE